MARVQFLVGAGIFLFALTSRSAWGSTQCPLQWVLEAVSLGVKWLGHDGDHSHLSSAEIKNGWNYNSTPPYVFMVRCLIKHRAIFTFYISAVNHEDK
jgi:hypothetical protein